MTIHDGEVLGAVQILDNGDPAERFNLVLVAEGYRESELGQFAIDADHFVAGLLATAPFNLHPCAFNIWRLDVASTDSGADDPLLCDGTGATPDTYFDARFCYQGIKRALVCNSSLVLKTVDEEVLPECHSAQVIVNSPIYGGTGGTVGVASTATQNGQGDPVDWREILIHEMGHSIFALGDEYDYRKGCDTDESGQDNYYGPEPGKPNVTKWTSAQGKWSDMVNASQLPTYSNPDCTKCAPDIEPPPSSYIVGTYEGAYYHHCDIYRPSYDCKMRKLGVPFCRVCQRVIHEYLATYDPVHCPLLDIMDPSRWMAVATILCGVTQDGGGLIWVGDKPIPIDPWGPIRHSLWAALANPQDAPPVVRDALVGLALSRLTELVASNRHRKRLERDLGRMMKDVADRLPAYLIR